MIDRLGSESPPTLPSVLAGLALDYFRWTQLVPMIMAWTFLLLMVAAMLVVNFQQQSFGLLDAGVRLYERFAGPLEPVDAGPSAAADPATAGEPERDPGAGEVTFDEGDVEPLVLKIWGVVALAGWLLGMAWRLLFGPPPRLSLKRKLAFAALACSACTGLFLFAYLFGSEEFNDPLVQWLALFIGIPAVVWCVSAYSLGISAAVDLAKRGIYRSSNARSAR